MFEKSNDWDQRNLDPPKSPFKRTSDRIPPLFEATVYTQLSYGHKIPNDPPKSPLLRGTMSPVPPFTKGGLGGIQTGFPGEARLLYTR